MGIGRFVEYKETRHDEGSIRPPLIVAYRPLPFHREVRGDMFAGQLILLPSLGVKQSVFIMELDRHM